MCGCLKCRFRGRGIYSSQESNFILLFTTHTSPILQDLQNEMFCELLNYCNPEMVAQFLNILGFKSIASVCPLIVKFSNLMDVVFAASFD